MRGPEIRQAFLDFFRAQGHPIVPSDSLVPHDDPTLLFTGAGMNQFKAYFLGFKQDRRRAASCQKCFRTGDVEQVGRTPSHLTFFEMLGNFSFGDYFKAEAIGFAWSLLTERLKLSPRRLWASVYESDEETARIWNQQVGLPRERIVRFGAKENFWPSDAPTQGPNGPCGPCSEIYYDYERCTIGKVCPDPVRCSPACGCGRFVEVWNLVFTQFDRQPDGSLRDLPAKNIDTGMGLERLAAVMQGKMSVFETDLFAPLVQEALSLLPDRPDRSRRQETEAVHAIADHARALTFLISDGVVPSNDGRGYVLRMLLRRAVRRGRALGLTRPFLYRLIPAVVRIMQGAYPELLHRREAIAKTVLTEEERFLSTLTEKIPLLEETLRLAQGPGDRRRRPAFDAEAAARFYDTHGLSYGEISEVCRAKSVEPPEREAFEEALRKLQARSKASSRFGGEIFAQDQLLTLVRPLAASTPFVGYTQLSSQAKVLGLIQENRLVEEVRAPARLGVILDRTPFYGEAGGQVGDAGTLTTVSGARLQVADTQWVGDLLLHEAELEAGTLRAGEVVTAEVDAGRRRKIARNHTATHLLHAALRRVLGEHVVQAGSLVAADYLRFDFSHSRALSAAEKRSVESLVNEWIEARLAVLIRQMPLLEAKQAGALALFAQKYADPVRVVSIGSVSMELCGGTHLDASDEVGLLTLVEEGSVAAGMRRVKAVSNQAARQALLERSVRAQQAVEQAERKEQKKKEQAQRKEILVRQAHEKASRLRGERVGPFCFFVHRADEPMGPFALRACSDAIRRLEPEAVIFLSDAHGFCLGVAGESARGRGISAGEMLGIATEVAGGSGGGPSTLAQGRIQDPSRFEHVAKRLREYLQGRVRQTR